MFRRKRQLVEHDDGYTISETADILGVSVQAVYLLIHAGRLPTAWGRRDGARPGPRWLMMIPLSREQLLAARSVEPRRKDYRDTNGPWRRFANAWRHWHERIGR